MGARSKKRERALVLIKFSINQKFMASKVNGGQDLMDFRGKVVGPEAAKGRPTCDWYWYWYWDWESKGNHCHRSLIACHRWYLLFIYRPLVFVQLLRFGAWTALCCKRKRKQVCNSSNSSNSKWRQPPLNLVMKFSSPSFQAFVSCLSLSSPASCPASLCFLWRWHYRKIIRPRRFGALIAHSTQSSWLHREASCSSSWRRSCCQCHFYCHCLHWSWGNAAIYCRRCN